MEAGLLGGAGAGRLDYACGVGRSAPA